MSFNNSTQCQIIKAVANSVFIISIVWSMIGSIHAVGFSRRRKKISAVGTCRKKKSYLMAAAGILVGYLFFFTSSLWYPGQNNASEYTPIGQLQKIGETDNSVTIEYWAYASEQQAMYVELDVNTAEKVSFEAVDKKGEKFQLL